MAAPIATHAATLRSPIRSNRRSGDQENLIRLLAS
jgi:hypothetical protein